MADRVKARCGIGRDLYDQWETNLHAWKQFQSITFMTRLRESSKALRIHDELCDCQR